MDGMMLCWHAERTVVASMDLDRHHPEPIEVPMVENVYLQSLVKACRFFASMMKPVLLAFNEYSLARDILAVVLWTAPELLGRWMGRTCSLSRSWEVLFMV